MNNSEQLTVNHDDNDTQPQTNNPTPASSEETTDVLSQLQAKMASFPLPSPAVGTMTPPLPPQPGSDSNDDIKTTPNLSQTSSSKKIIHQSNQSLKSNKPDTDSSTVLKIKH